MEKQPCIYKITNLINNKIYIGQTKTSFKDRKKAHLSKLRRNKHDNTYLQSSFNKYGEDNMKFSVIEYCKVEDLDELEIKYISDSKSQNPLFGYNLESGGKTNKTLSELTKIKLSRKTKELNFTGSNHPRAKKVICINDGKVFGSVIECSDFYKIPYANISQVLLGKNNCCVNSNGDFIQFSYYEEGKEYHLKEINEKTIKKPKMVICLNTGEIFKSTREASKKSNVQQGKISMVCNGKRNFAGTMEDGSKIKWAFYNEHLSN